MTDLRELLRPRVERGAALLDSVEPYWWKRVEVALDLSDCKRCVLGQVYGDYFDAKYELCIDPVSHGFDTYNGPDYPVLDDLWLEAIEARRQS